MGRAARDKRDLPHPKPVQKIQLSGENMGPRLAAAAVFLVVGALALAYAFTQLLSPETGWQAIEVSSADATCGGEFVFLYELGAGESAPAAESNAITALYTDACQKLFQLFHTTESFEGIANLREINLHPNETVVVDGMLYHAFELIQRYGDRTIYLGPVYERYNGLFYCADDSQLVEFDPYLSDEVREEYGAVARFARDPQAIDLRLLGDNQVCLYVSEEYLAYARRNEIERFLDFGWLKNAFAVDYLADLMMENGYTNGSISSYDGFIRNLDVRELDYSLNLYDLAGGTIYQAGVMQYRGPMSIVYLRDYSTGGMDSQRIYQLENGERRTTYLSLEDGRCRSAAIGLVCYSKTAGCAEAALRAAPIYVAETLDVPALERLAGSGIQSIRCENRVIRGTDPGLVIADLYEGENVRYTVSLG